MESELRYRTIFETLATLFISLMLKAITLGGSRRPTGPACEMLGTRRRAPSMNIQELNTPETQNHTPWPAETDHRGETLKTECSTTEKTIHHNG